MSDFKVGDRVAVYNSDGRIQGAVTGVDENGFVIVRNDRDQPYMIARAHPKQCRKLIKREYRRVWIHDGVVTRLGAYGLADHPANLFSQEPKEGYAEFREVRRK